MGNVLVPIIISLQERDLLLKSDIFIDEEILAKIRLAQTSGSNVRLSLTLQDLDLFLDSLAAEANHTESAKKQRALDRLYDRLSAVFEQHTGFPGLEELDDSNPDDDLADKYNELTDESEDESHDPLVEMIDPSLKDEVNELLALASRKLFSTPNRNLSGLTLGQAHFLCEHGWWSEAAPMTVNRNLPPDDFAAGRLIHNARTLLQLIEETDGVPLTTAGNMKSKFVGLVFERFRWVEGYRESLQAAAKKLKEQSLPELTFLRTLLEEAGLLETVDNRLVLTAAGRKFLAAETTGELAFLVLDLMVYQWKSDDDEDFIPMCNLGQMSPLWLYHLGRLPVEKKLSLKQITELLVPIPPREIDNPEHPLFLARFFLYDHFLPFLLGMGLLTVVGKEPLLINPEGRIVFRKTALFDRFIGFEALPAELQFDA